MQIKPLAYNQAAEIGALRQILFGYRVLPVLYITPRSHANPFRQSKNCLLPFTCFSHGPDRPHPCAFLRATLIAPLSQTDEERFSTRKEIRVTLKKESKISI